MLRPEVLKIVKQSVPVLSENGEAITQCFYRILFERYPQLKNFFNLANQRNGNQAKALADAIFAYANLAEQPELLGPMVNRIAHKHVSLNIKAEHYPMVGEALLMALSEKLGIDMEHEIIQAWGEAYQSLAEVFINHEQGIYQKNAKQTGGWQGFREFKITNIVEETPIIKSFYLESADSGENKERPPLFKPGQYIGVKLDIPGHPYEEIRQYSLSDMPGQSHYRITVKAEPGSPKGMISNYLHEQMSVNDRLLISAPCGDFTLPEAPERNTVLISGGVGITPMMSMLKAQLHTQTGNQLTFIHCTQDAKHHSFLDETIALREQFEFDFFTSYMEQSDGDHQGFLNHEAMDKFLPDSDADYYFCGPFPFMVALRNLLVERGIAEDRIHYEVFGPTLSLAA